MEVVLKREITLILPLGKLEKSARPHIVSIQTTAERTTVHHLCLRPKLIINLNPFLPIRHRNFNPKLCLSVPIMYPHCEL
jgi:hypothetical protein